MNESKTHIAVVVDRSGSITSIRSDTIGGFNTFLRDQQAEPGEATLSLVLFDHEYQPVYTMRPLAEVPELTTETYVPRGNTALLDAIGRTINETGAALAAIPEAERPGRVVFVIITDGHENSSREFNRYRVLEMIRHQSDVYGWQFVFLGANQDAIVEAGSIGIKAANAVSYTASSVGVANVIRHTSDNLRSYRRTGVAADVGFSEHQRSEAMADSKDKTA